jgi:hypothetical protein
MSDSKETFLNLNFKHTTPADEQQEVRQLAVFMYAKLCAAGVDRIDAKSAVEQLFYHGWRTGQAPDFGSNY